MLAQLSEQLDGRDDVPRHVRERIGRMHEFMGTLAGWYDDVRKLPKSTLVTLMKLGSRVARFLFRAGRQACGQPQNPRAIGGNTPVLDTPRTTTDFSFYRNNRS